MEKKKSFREAFVDRVKVIPTMILPKEE